MTVKVIKHFKVGKAISLKKMVSRDEPSVGREINETLTESDLEQEKQTSYDQAYQAGIEHAKQELSSQFRQEIEQELMTEQNKESEQIKILIASVHENQANHHKEHGSLAVDMVSQLLSHFFIQPTLQKTNIEHSVNQAVEQLDTQTKVTVKISKLDYQLLQQRKIDLTTKDNISYIPSDEVLIGGCLIESEQGIFDGRLENQIDKLKQVLLHYKQQAVNNG